MGILTCLPPFQNRESSMDGDKVPLFASLGEDIRALQRSMAENGLTLQWCNESVAVMKKMHSLLVTFFENSNVLDEYMNESLNIMELCNLLKSAASDINRYIFAVDFAVKNIDNIPLLEIQKLELDSSKFSGIQRWKKNNIKMHKPAIIQKCRDSSTNSIIYAIRSAMAMISSILLNAFCYHIPVKVKHDKLYYCLNPQIKSFMESVKDLTSCFEQRHQENHNLAFLEYVLMEKAIDETKAQLNKGMAAEEEELQRNRRLIEQKSLALKAGLEVFESEISQLFEEALRGRNKLLQMILKKDAT